MTLFMIQVILLLIIFGTQVAHQGLLVMHIRDLAILGLSLTPVFFPQLDVAGNQHQGREAVLNKNLLSSC